MGYIVIVTEAMSLAPNGETKMTRNEFDRFFAATEQNTQGYTAAELREINDRVFAAVAEIDAEDQYAKTEIDAVMERELARH